MLDLGELGLPEAERARHIAWDIGVAGLSAMLAEMLDAAFIRQTYSHLVVDCKIVQPFASVGRKNR